jgi:hypothetical protein
VSSGKTPLWRRKSWVVGNLAFAFAFGVFNLTTGHWWGTNQAKVIVQALTLEARRRM